MALDDRLSDLLVDWEQSQRDGREPTLEELCKDAPELLPVVRQSIDSLKATRWMLEPDPAATSADDRSTDGLRTALHDTELPASHLTVEQFAASIFQSGLLSPGEIHELNQRLTASDLPGEAREIASRLVTEGKLTRYQASVLLKASKDPLLIDNYVILDTLDTGGMGLVFKALHRSMNRVVALKLLPAAMMGARDTVKRFQREVQAAAALSHPNIVAAYDAHQSSEIAYLVLEYVEGVNLFRLVKERGPLPVAVAANYVRQAATGLAYLHSRGIIHRDVKPANLILADDGTVKLLDMGLVRFASAEDLSCAEMDQELTQAGIVIGTVAYMSPEQALDTRSADQRSDIYSLGCTLFFLLTGRSLYHEETGMKTLLAHREQPVPTIREFCEEAPVSLDAVFRTMVAKRPADRLQSMSEVVAAIDACVPGMALNAPATTYQRRIASRAPAGASRLARGWKHLRSNPLRMALTIALLAAVAAGGTYLAGILIRIKTKQGTTEVLVDDPGAEVTVRRVSDGAKDSQSLIDGKKQIPLGDERADWTPSPTNSIPAPTQASNTPPIADRLVAKWVLSGRGNFVFLRESGQVEDLAKLPTGEIHLLGINNRRGLPLKLAASDVERLASLSELVSLRLQSPSVTDEIVLRLKTLTKLKALSLIHARISDACLPALTDMSRLSFLDLSDTPITDAGLDQIAKMKSLNDPSLPAKNDPRNIESATLLYLGGIKEVPLPALILDNTRTTEGRLLKLQRELSSCNIYASHVYPGRDIVGIPLPPKPGSSDIEWAKWLLDYSSKLGCWIRTDLDPATVVKKTEDLPPLDFHIHGLGFVSANNQTSYGVNAFLLRRLGELKHLRVLFLDQGRTDHALDGLSALKSLTTLVLGDINAGDGVFQPLPELTGLTTLVIDGDKITDAGIKTLVPLKNLSRLVLNGRAKNLHGSGFAALSGLTKLRTLELGRSGVDDDGARSIGRLTNLEKLDIHETWISGKGLSELSGLKRLKTLSLEGCRRLQAEDLAPLGELSALEHLDLSGCRITNEASAGLVKTLQRLKNLRTLNLAATSVSPQQFSELRSVLPQLVVTWPQQASAQPPLEAALSGDQPQPKSAPIPGASPKQSQLNWGGTSKSAPQPQERSAAGLPNVDREVAEWVLSQRGNVVSVRDSGRCDNVEKLPPGEVHLDGIAIASKSPLNPQDPEVERWASLSQLNWLVLRSPSITDKLILRLSKLTNLTRLSLHGASVTDSCLPALAGMTHLSGLDLSQTRISDAGLEQVARLKSLNDVALANENARKGWNPGWTSPRGASPAVMLDNTRTTEAGVLKFQQALPNCSIFASHIYPHPGNTLLPLPPGVGSSDRDWANWLLSHRSLHCRLYADVDPETGIVRAEDLPPIAFHIQRLGFELPSDPSVPQAICDLNAFFFRRLADLPALRELDIAQQVPAEALLGLTTIKTLEKLSIQNTNAGDFHLEAIAKLNGLKSLWFRGEMITDAGLRRLASLKELTILNLNGRARDLHGSGFEALSVLTKLRTLDVSGSGIDDEGIRQIGRLAGLRKLVLRQTWISGKGLVGLAGLKDLKILSLSRCRRLQADDLAPLGEIGSLGYLDLSECRITDRSFAPIFDSSTTKSARRVRHPSVLEAPLLKLKNLTVLDLSGTALSSEYLPEIKGRFYGVDVTVQPRPLPDPPP